VSVEIHYSEEFWRSYENLLKKNYIRERQDSIIKKTIASIQESPQINDGQLPQVKGPHWMRRCRDEGYDAGLRIVYVLRAEGGVLIEDIFAIPRM
jgi:mRNA-degrading endonuclease YafQ of YafQ-DinJ toxin-antitoxin module